MGGKAAGWHHKPIWDPTLLPRLRLRSSTERDGRPVGWVNGGENFHQNQLCMTPVCCSEPDDGVLGCAQEESRGSDAGKWTERQRVGKNKVRAADYALVCLASSK